MGRGGRGDVGGEGGERERGEKGYSRREEIGRGSKNRGERWGER